MIESELDRRWRLAVDLTIEAGQRTLRYFQKPRLIVERKSDDSPVTVADREAEIFLRDSLLRAFPDDGFVGEEFGKVDGSSDFCWIADPIDGTKSFISGVPLYSSLVGLLWRDQSVAGVIAVPGLDECVHAARGRGARLRKGNQESTIRVSDRTSLKDAVFVTSQLDTFERRQAQDVFSRLQQSAYVTRTWGDGYGYLLVACGRVDVMIDPVMNLWDAAAIQPVIEEAGGVFCDWEGTPTVHSGEGLATNPHLLQEVLSITRGHSRPS